MVESAIALLDWLGIVAFTTTGALAASRNQMDAVGFVLLGTVTGIGGTLCVHLLDVHPILWIEHPVYLAVCVGVCSASSSPRISSTNDFAILWLDAVGLPCSRPARRRACRQHRRGADRRRDHGRDHRLVAGG